MAEAKIALPDEMTLSNVLKFISHLDKYKKYNRISIDFGTDRFFRPFTMLMIASKLKWISDNNPDAAFEFIHFDSHPYAAHMGFFKMFGMDHGRAVGEARGSEDYLPITCLNRQALYERPTDTHEEVQDLIQRHADKISNVISRGKEKNKNMYDALSYSIREVMRNVFEHSGANSLYYCSQYWPRSNKVEFAIADFGMGIRKSLRENPNFRLLNTDKDAIEYSLLPGVSGKTHQRRMSENWFNSGYGLYMTSRLARNGGSFIIASGSSAIYLSNKQKTNGSTLFDGTILSVNMHVEKIGNVEARLKEFRQDADKIANSLKNTAGRPPSAMSMLLRREFR